MGIGLFVASGVQPRQANLKGNNHAVINSLLFASDNSKNNDNEVTCVHGNNYLLEVAFATTEDLGNAWNDLRNLHVG